jgi:hypothetical protein
MKMFIFSRDKTATLREFQIVVASTEEDAWVVLSRHEAGPGGKPYVEQTKGHYELKHASVLSFVSPQLVAAILCHTTGSYVQIHEAVSS